MYRCLTFHFFYYASYYCILFTQLPWYPIRYYFNHMPTVFLRIDGLVNAVNLNLGEVKLYNGNIQLPDLVSRASMSSEYLTPFEYIPLRNCFDGNIDSFCSSRNGDQNPWLQVDITGLEFDRVVVENRKDCCSFRIVGARIALMTATGVVKWSSTFAIDQTQYTFTPGI